MNALRNHLFTGSPMSRYEFAIRLLAEGCAAPSGGVYGAGTLIIASALFASAPPGALIRLGRISTEEDLQIFETISRRQSGKLTRHDRDVGGPWPHEPNDVRDFLAREMLKYNDEIRERLMSERRSAGLPMHDHMYVMSAVDSSEIGAPYTIAALDSEFRRALKVMEINYPESHAHYASEMTSVDKLVSFLRWKMTPTKRVIDDPLNEVQATLLLYTSSPIRIQSGEAMRYLDNIAYAKAKNGKLPGLGG